MQKIPVGIIGVSGYTGLELVKILLAHPVFELVYCAGSEECEEIALLHASLKGSAHNQFIRQTSQTQKNVASFYFLPCRTKRQWNVPKRRLKMG